MGRLYDGLIETFNPEAKGPAARTAGSVIAQDFFHEAWRQNQIWEVGKDRRNYWIKMGTDASLRFLFAADEGKKFVNPLWEQIRQDYDKWGDRLVEQDRQTYASSGKDLPYAPLEHYIPRVFKDGPGVVKFLTSKYGNKWADPRFTKQRGYRYLKEAYDAGFTLKTTNPEELMQMRQHASDIAELRTNMLADLERRGVALRAEKGAERAPAGYHPETFRSPTGVRYWIKEEAYPLMQNAFNTASLWNLQGNWLKSTTSVAFRGWMGLKNSLIPFKLAFSAFHPLHVTHIDAAAELTRVQQLALGNPTAANITKMLGQMVTGTPTNPIGAVGMLYRSWYSNPKTGYPLLQVFRGKLPFDQLSPMDKAAFRDLAEGGMVPTRPMEETSNAMQRTMDLIRSNGATKLKAGNPLLLSNAALAAINYPLYNIWIPTLKIASFIKDAKAWREMNPQAPDNVRQEAFRQLARRVEARYGEMNYNSMFMNKILKDVGTGTTLSLGWDLGQIDLYAGGAIDVAKLVADPKSTKAKAAANMYGRPLFMANYVATAAVIGGLMTYYFGKRMPTSWLDYTNPDSGEKDQYGKPIRWNTPFYTHEASSIEKHVEQEGVAAGVSDFVWSKGSGMYDTVKSTFTGVNTLHDEIRDSTSPAFQQLEQTLAYELGELNSISLKALDLAPDANETKMRTMSVLGFGPAGKYIDRTAAEGQINKSFNEHNRPEQRTFQAAQMSKDTKELRRMYKTDDPKYNEKLDAMIERYDLDPKDVSKIQKQFAKDEDFDISVYQFSKLEYSEKKRLLNSMKSEDREKYLPHLSKHDQEKYARETEQ